MKKKINNIKQFCLINEQQKRYIKSTILNKYTNKND